MVGQQLELRSNKAGGNNGGGFGRPLSRPWISDYS
jgi:hypothetical protein